MSFANVWRQPSSFPLTSVTIGATAAILAPVLWGLAFYLLGQGVALPWEGANVCQTLAGAVFLPLVFGGFASVWNMRLAVNGQDRGLRYGAAGLATAALIVTLFAALIFLLMLHGSVVPSACTTGN